MFMTARVILYPKDMIASHSSLDLDLENAPLPGPKDSSDLLQTELSNAKTFKASALLLTRPW